MRRGEIFREKGREERDWEGNERERESLEGGRETETEMLGEGKKIRQREKETRDKERCGNRGRSREGEGHREKMQEEQAEGDGDREAEEGREGSRSERLIFTRGHCLSKQCTVCTQMYAYHLPDFNFISQTSMHV